MEYRPIEIWNHKLENMYTILTAEDGLSKFFFQTEFDSYHNTIYFCSLELGTVVDEFESEFKLVRDNLK